MQKVNKFTYTIAALLAVIVFIFSSLWGGGAAVVHAATSTTTAFEQSNVLDDLTGSVIGGKAFNLADYPFNTKGEPQIVSFAEYGYSYKTEKQSDYGLYLYIYNPQGLKIDTNTERNKVQFSYGGKANWTKYVLNFLNYSMQSGYEGLFYKFKIALSENQRSSLLATLSQNSRMYEISGVELSVNGVVTDYAIDYNKEKNKILTYTYSGYAKGYGSELAIDDTLSCTVDGLKETLSLNVHSTYYRPSGTNGEDYSRDTLHSVYFSIPDTIIEKYGEMSAVHATWLNALTSPVFVTGNESIYNAVSNYLGQYVDGGDYRYIGGANYNTELSYSLIASKYIESSSWNHASHSLSYMSYNANRTYTNSNVNVYNLAYCFLADKVNGERNADYYILPAEMLIGNKKEDKSGWFETYTETHGGELVNNRFSKELFAEVADSYTDITIRKDDTFTLTDEIISQDLWQRFIGGGYNVTGKNEYQVSAIKRVEKNDFKSTKTQTCNDLYIDESDYVEFKAFYDEVTKKENPETVYLFRYYQSPYIHYEVAEFQRGKGDWTMAGTEFDYDFVDTNAYFMQMWVQLDFDIIDVTFTKNGVKTVIPVVMSPVDLAGNGGTTLFPTDDNNDLLKWVKLVLGLLVGILIVVLLYPVISPFLSFIVKGLLWLIKLPFKAMGALFKAIFKRAGG